MEGNSTSSDVAKKNAANGVGFNNTHLHGGKSGGGGRGQGGGGGEGGGFDSQMPFLLQDKPDYIDVDWLKELQACKTKRELINTIHSKNLTSQRQHPLFEKVLAYVSTDQRLRSEKSRNHLIEIALWMMEKKQRTGPMGESPLHLFFLLEQGDIGQEIIKKEVERRKPKDAAEEFRHYKELVNTPYGSDLNIVLKPRDHPPPLLGQLQEQVNRIFSDKRARERQQGEQEKGKSAGNGAFRYGDNHPIDEALKTYAEGGRDGGMFTGETPLHIAIVQHDRKLVKWLLDHGAELHARAMGIFFQPGIIERFRDEEWVSWNKKEKNEKGGACYYGELPLSFAASVGDVEICQMLLDRAREIIEKEDDDELIELLHRWTQDELVIPNTDDPNFKDEEALLNSYINMSDARGNTALHMAVMHRQKDTIDWLLRNSADPSMELLNDDDFTPLTLAVRSDAPEIFNHLVSKIHEVAWSFGTIQMTVVPLHQLDTFRSSLLIPSSTKHRAPATKETYRMRVRSKRYLDEKKHEKKMKEDWLRKYWLDRVVSVARWLGGTRKRLEKCIRPHKVVDATSLTDSLHNDPHWRSALEVVVEHEISSFAREPIFQDLVFEKWIKFGRTSHLLYTLLPFTVFLIACTVAFERRCRQIWSQTVNTGVEWSINKAPLWFFIALDILIYLIGIPFLLLQARKQLRFRYIDIDPNMDLSWSFDELIFWLYKNLIFLLHVVVVAFLVVIATIRLCVTGDFAGWYHVRPDYYFKGLELKMMAWAMMLLWCTFLQLLLPFRFVGPLLMTVWRMLIGDVFKWIIVYLFILAAFSQAVYILIQDVAISEGLVQDGSVVFGPAGSELTVNPASNFDYMSTYVWVTFGDVHQGLLDAIGSIRVDIWTLHIIFIALSTLLLVNLLIAIMGNTHSKNESGAGTDMWWMFHAYYVLRIESNLSRAERNRLRSGERMEQLENAGDESKHFRVRVENRKMEMAGGSADVRNYSDEREIRKMFREKDPLGEGVVHDFALLDAMCEVMESVNPGVEVRRHEVYEVIKHDLKKHECSEQEMIEFFKCWVPPERERKALILVDVQGENLQRWNIGTQKYPPELTNLLFPQQFDLVLWTKDVNDPRNPKKKQEDKDQANKEAADGMRQAEEEGGAPATATATATATAGGARGAGGYTSSYTITKASECKPEILKGLCDLNTSEHYVLHRTSDPSSSGAGYCSSCFFEQKVWRETGLRRFLKEQKITTVVVGGFLFNGVVGTTALDAVDCGFRSIVVDDCSDNQMRRKDKMKDLLKQRGVEILRSQNVVVETRPYKKPAIAETMNKFLGRISREEDPAVVKILNKLLPLPSPDLFSTISTRATDQQIEDGSVQGSEQTFETLHRS